MANLVDWITKAADGEPVEAVVIGKTGWDDDYKSDLIPRYTEQPHGRLLTWEDAKPYLNYEFSDGYGAPSCNAVIAWTATKVLTVMQYDGSTWLQALPRHPVEHMPSMPGV